MLLQRQTHALRPLTTAHLAQTMTLLGLTTIELRQKVEAALSSNPALELLEGKRCPICRRILSGQGTCPFCSRPQSAGSDQPVVFVSPYEDFRSSYKSTTTPEDHDEAYNQTPEIEDLPRYVLRQIAPDLPAADRPLAAYILTNLNEDGLLTTSLAEIARYHHISLSQVSDVLKLIQRADPVGVASTTPQEALLVQLDALSEVRKIPAQTRQAISQGMDLLSRHRYKELGQMLGISANQAREIAQFISDNLNPYPARAHWGEASSSQHSSESPLAYHSADVIISRLREDENSPLVVEVAIPLAGVLRVNPLFRAAIRQAPAEKAEQWKADLDQAVLLVKCLQQRNHTLVRLMQCLVVLQRDYILSGDAHLLPITRAHIAKQLDVHESTISRAVASKSVQLPNGHIVPMSVFFDRSLHIRTALKKIIASETVPLSDTEIGERLAYQGFAVARRTVTKYRIMEGILPAHLRRHA